MATVEDLPTGLVTGQFLFVSQDNADEGTAPNSVLVTGYVRFTCTATPPLLYKSRKVLAVPLVADAAFDAQGHLIPLDPSQAVAVVVNGKLERGIALLGDSPDVSPRNFNWQVSFNLREVATGRAIAIPSYQIRVSAGETIDLSEVTPVGQSNGVSIIRGESNYELAVSNGYKGTLEEWLESIKGEPGEPGANIVPTQDAIVREVTNPDSPVSKAIVVQVSSSARTEVAKAIAADSTIAESVSLAVGDALGEKGVVHGATSSLLGPDDSVWRHTTKDGDFLPLGYGPDLHLDNFAKKIFKEDINNSVDAAMHPEYARVMKTQNDEILAALRWDGTWFLPGLEGVASEPAPTPEVARVFYNDVPYTPESDVHPLHPDLLKWAGWGSSSMGGIASAHSSLANEFKAKYFNGGQGGEKSYHIAARLGSVPAKITFPENKIPASGAVFINSSNIDVNSLRTYGGYVVDKAGNRIFGKVGKVDNVLGFTRDTAGDEVEVAADVEFIPTDGVAQRDAVTFLWMGKNNISQTQRVIEETNTSFEYLVPLVKKVLVYGHFVNSGTAAGAASRTQIKTINDDHARRFGQAFIDVNGYLTSEKLWTDTGLTPTEADLADQALGNKPMSVSSDAGHLNGVGYKALIDNLIRPRLVSLGWFK